MTSDGPIQVLIAAARSRPDDSAGWRALIDAVAEQWDALLYPGVMEDLASAISRDVVERGRALRFFHLSLWHFPGLQEAMAAAAHGDAGGVDRALQHPAPWLAFATPLARATLARCPPAALDLEFVLSRMRRHLLLAEVGGKPPPPAADEVAALLAHQGFLTEYVWAEDSDEALHVSLLEANLEAEAADEHSVSPRPLAILASYRALKNMPWLAAHFQTATAPPPFADIVTRQLLEPAVERVLASAFAQLTPITNAVSREVQGFYDETPYPRWYGVPRSSPMAFADYIRTVAPNAAPVAPNDPPEILIAGCGTGLQVVSGRIERGKVLAVDISRVAMAFAKRNTASLPDLDVSFGVADLAELGTLDAYRGRFDLIICTGVLHHMESPERGLASLAACLRPGGVMRIEVYTARRSVDLARAQEIAKALAPDAGIAGVRKLRAAIFDALLKPGVVTALPPDLRWVATVEDFYSVSGCRDLLLHPQERGYTPRQLVDFVSREGLVFLGFRFTRRALFDAYRRQYPDDRKVQDPENVEAFERQTGEAISGPMYLVVVQKARPGPD